MLLAQTLCMTLAFESSMRGCAAIRGHVSLSASPVLNSSKVVQRVHAEGPTSRKTQGRRQAFGWRNRSPFEAANGVLALRHLFHAQPHSVHSNVVYGFRYGRHVETTRLVTYQSVWLQLEYISATVPTWSEIWLSRSIHLGSTNVSGST